eukprot:gene10334-13884_t
MEIQPLENNSDTHIIRPYQKRVLEAALKGNTIAFLPTGAGKTLISVFLIKERLQLIRKSITLNQSKKLIIFIAPTKLLVGQQRKYIACHCDANVSEWTGESVFIEEVCISLKLNTPWREWIKATEVLVMTPEIAKQLLIRKFFDVSDIDSIVLDECHHAFGNDPMLEICQIIKTSSHEVKPLILGMTASPIPCKKGLISNKILILEENMNCKLLCSQQILSEFRSLIPIPDFSLFRYKANTKSKSLNMTFTERIMTLANEAHAISIKDLCTRLPTEYDIRSFRSALMINAYVRLKQAATISVIYKFVRTILMEPNDFISLFPLNLPPQDVIDLYRKNEISLQDNDIYFKHKNKPYLPSSSMPFVGLPEFQQSLGQIMRVTEDCGVLCGLFSLRICCSSNSNNKALFTSANDTSNVNNINKSVNNKVNLAADTLFKGKKAKYLQSSSDLACVIDIENIGKMAFDIIQGPFKAVDLIDYEYLACVSMLDFFVSLASTFEPELCFQALDKIVKHFTENVVEISISMSIGESTDSINQKDESEWYLFPTMPLCHSLVCNLLHKLSFNSVHYKFSINGVLTLIPEFCEYCSKRAIPLVLFEDDCKLALADACNALISCMTTADIREEFEVDMLEQRYTFQSLHRSSEYHLFEDNGEGYPKDKIKSLKKESKMFNLTDIGFDFNLVSSKVKALFHVWAKISIYQRSQQATNDIAESFDEPIVISPDLHSTANNLSTDKIELVNSIENDDQLTMIASKLIDEKTKQIIDDWAGVVFCRMRLTAVSVHLVLSLLFNDSQVEKVSSTEPLGRVDLSTSTTLPQPMMKVVSDKEKSIAPTPAQLNDEIMSIKVDFGSQNLKFQPLHIVGQSKQKHQLDTLIKFKSGKFNILFATDVAEEGLDVRACQLVINFDLPSTLKSFIQRRGRARAHSSRIIALVPWDNCGKKMVEDIITFTKQEEDIEKLGVEGDNLARLDTLQDGDIEELQPLENVLETKVVEKEETIKLNVKSNNKREMSEIVTDEEHNSNPRNNDSKEANKRAKLDEGKILDSTSVVPVEKQFRLDTKIEEKYEVFSTGMVADLRNSSQILVYFCQQLPHDSFYSPRPIYWIDKVDLNLVHDWTVSNNGLKCLYRCSILLPPCVPQKYRCLVGPLAENKVQAKGLAALSCIRVLHKCGQLSDWLVTNGSKTASKTVPGLEKIVKKRKAEVEGDEMVDSKNADSVKVNAEEAESELVSIWVKTVPDVMTLPSEDISIEALSNDSDNQTMEMTSEENESNTCATLPIIGDSSVTSSNVMKPSVNSPPKQPKVISTGLYLYAVRSVLVDEITKTITSKCMGCASQYSSVNRIGFALTRALPNDVVNSVFDTYLRESEGVKVSLEYLGYRHVSNSDLAQMQRFHRSCLCWDSETKRYDAPDPSKRAQYSTAGLMDESWISFDADLSDYPTTPPMSAMDEDNLNGHKSEPFTPRVFSHDEWRESSNGAWYLLFPLSNDLIINALAENVEDPLNTYDDLQSNEQSTFKNPEKWSAFLKKCADDAQILVHNLRMQEHLNIQELSEFNQPLMKPVQPEIMPGLLLSRGPGGIFWAIASNNSKIHLNDVMKYLKTTPPEENIVENNDNQSNEMQVENNHLNQAHAVFQPSSRGTISALNQIFDDYKDDDMIIEENNGKEINAVIKGSEVPVYVKKLSPDLILGVNAFPVTFMEHFRTKYITHLPFLDEHENDENYVLQEVWPVASRLTLTHVLGKPHTKGIVERVVDRCMIRRKIIAEEERRIHTHTSSIHLIPELCRGIGKVKWMLVGQVAPSIIWRIQSLLLSVETRGCIVKAVKSFEDAHLLKNVDNMVDKNGGEVVQDDLFHERGMDSPLVVPNATLMLEAITPRMARELIDSERLELLGDSLLKLVTSVEVFRLYPDKHEGFLTSSRAKWVSNFHLTEMAKSLGLDRYLRAYPLSAGKQLLNIRPPGMLVEQLQRKLCLWNKNVIPFRANLGDGVQQEGDAMNDVMHDSLVDHNHEVKSNKINRESEGVIDPASVISIIKEGVGVYVDDTADADPATYYKTKYPIPQHEQSMVKPKALADLIEAIIGGFYVEGGLESGVAAIKALGAWPLVHNEDEVMEFPENFPEPLKRIALGKADSFYNDGYGNDSNTSEKKIKNSTKSANQSNANKASTVPLFVEPSLDSAASVLRVNQLTEQIIASETIHFFAQIIGYSFKQYSILTLALTHCSIQHRPSNQRLEFLGDAVMDFAVVSLLFANQPWATQGDLSNQKSLMTCNKNLGVIALSIKLHKKLHILSPQLEIEFDLLDKLINNISENNNNNDDGSINHNSSEEKQRVLDLGYFQNAIRKNIKIANGPNKALADVLEALVGAVFMDSGSLDEVKKMLCYINLVPPFDL